METNKRRPSVACHEARDQRGSEVFAHSPQIAPAAKLDLNGSFHNATNFEEANGAVFIDDGSDGLGRHRQTSAHMNDAEAVPGTAISTFPENESQGHHRHHEPRPHREGVIRRSLKSIFRIKGRSSSKPSLSSSNAANHEGGLQIGSAPPETAFAPPVIHANDCREPQMHLAKRRGSNTATPKAPLGKSLGRVLSLKQPLSLNLDKTSPEKGPITDLPETSQTQTQTQTQTQRQLLQQQDSKPASKFLEISAQPETRIVSGYPIARPYGSHPTSSALRAKSLSMTSDRSNGLPAIGMPLSSDSDQMTFVTAKPRSRTISRYEIASPVKFKGQTAHRYHHAKSTSSGVDSLRLDSPSIRKSLCLDEFGVGESSESKYFSPSSVSKVNSGKSSTTQSTESGKGMPNMDSSHISPAQSEQQKQSNVQITRKPETISARTGLLSKTPEDGLQPSHLVKQPKPESTKNLTSTPKATKTISDSATAADTVGNQPTNTATTPVSITKNGKPHSSQPHTEGYLQNSRQQQQQQLEEALPKTAAIPCEENNEEISPVQETSRMVIDYDPRTGRKMINQYVLLRELGRGVHGKVRLALDTVSKEYYAIKIIDKVSHDRRLRQPSTSEAAYTAALANCPYLKESPKVFKMLDFDRLEKVKREVAILKKCNHPNIVKLREVIDDPHARRIYLVVEYVTGGEIKWRDEQDKSIFSLDQARRIFRGLLLGVEYLHYHGIIHRDIKPANLLCTDSGIVKISDFGVSFLRSKPFTKKATRTASQNHHHHSHKQQEQEQEQKSKGLAVGESKTFNHATLSNNKQFSIGQALARNPLSVVKTEMPSITVNQTSGPGSSRSLEGDNMIVPSKSFPVTRAASQPLLFSGALRGSMNYKPSITHLTEGIPGAKSGGVANGGRYNESIKVTGGISPGNVLDTIDSWTGILAADIESQSIDPFDLSDSDEFFSSDSEGSSDIKHQIGSVFTENGKADSDNDNFSDDDDALMIGSKQVSRTPPPHTVSTEAFSEKRDDNVAPSGSLNAVNIEYDEEAEEKELAKTAGTPSFFAPELCCTADELMVILRQRRMKLLTDTAPIPLGLKPSVPEKSGHKSRHRYDADVSPRSHGLAGNLSIPNPPGPNRKTRHNRMATLGSLLIKPLGFSPGTGGTIAQRVDTGDILKHQELEHTPSSSTKINGTNENGISDNNNRHHFHFHIHRNHSNHGSESIAEGTTSDEPDRLLTPRITAHPTTGASGNARQNVVTPAIDIWAMGVTLYCLVCGKVPFKADTEFELFEIIPRKELEFPTDINLPPSLMDLLQRLLDKDYRTRITIEEIKTHPWVLQDLTSPSHWISDTHPIHRPILSVTKEEMDSAVLTVIHKKLRARIRRGVSKISKSISAGLRSRSASVAPKGADAAN
ncbi:hypothetical protein H4219_003292 [Mycoemilia scoparia]|uniref:Protein kinase domain-containing protein n=1 Tax=Mycoemilia scoparia TaxID=417184 RepID=A0A9W8A0X6_9FUNG|nr:hypothetical protein H4219_003292 [Mycoemilia scoparia]